MATPADYTPTHPDLFMVDFQPGDFASRLIALRSFKAEEVITGLHRFVTVPHATHDTVQCGPDPGDNIKLHSDLVYVNHSCEPNVTFDLSSKDKSQWHVRALRRIRAGDPVTFFYPSTEWKMAQPFDCLCGSQTCMGRIEGAFSLSVKELSGRGFINPWILAQLEEKANDPPVE